MAPVWLRDAMSTAVDGNEFHLHFGVVAPEHVLDANAVGDVGLVRPRYARDVVQVRKILP